MHEILLISLSYMYSEILQREVFFDPNSLQGKQFSMANFESELNSEIEEYLNDTNLDDLIKQLRELNLLPPNFSDDETRIIKSLVVQAVRSAIPQFPNDGFAIENFPALITDAGERAFELSLPKYGKYPQLHKEISFAASYIMKAALANIAATDFSLHAEADMYEKTVGSLPEKDRKGWKVDSALASVMFEALNKFHESLAQRSN